MSTLEFPGMSPFDAIRRVDDSGEHWLGRELMLCMGYGTWERFADVIVKARTSLALVQGESAASDHFAGWRSDGGRWGNQSLDDFRLTRFGAYLVAMAGDDTKRSVAEARIYFAVKTREAETAPAAPRELSRREMAQYWLEAETRAEVAEQRVAELEPAAGAWRSLASADGDWSVREAAYILNREHGIDTGARRLFDRLREWGVIDGHDIPYASHARHVRLRARSYTNPATGEECPARPQVRVTADGIAYLRKQFAKAVTA